MSEALSGPERMIQTAMKLMGFKPEEMLARFQVPIETGLQGIKDVDKRLTNLENTLARILTILEGRDDAGTGHERDSRQLEFDGGNGTEFQRLTG